MIDLVELKSMVEKDVREHNIPIEEMILYNKFKWYDPPRYLQAKQGQTLILSFGKCNKFSLNRYLVVGWDADDGERFIEWGFEGEYRYISKEVWEKKFMELQIKCNL